jgi:hypothetical protein
MWPGCDPKRSPSVTVTVRLDAEAFRRRPSHRRCIRALAGEEAVDDTVRASASIGFGGLLLGGQGGTMSSVEQSPEVAVPCASPDLGDPLLGAVVFEHLVDRVQLLVVV